jgi:hypothetical protein
MKLAFNQKDVTNTGKYLGEGTNTVKIKKVMVQTNPNTGNESLHVELIGVAESQGKEGTEFLSLSPKARFRIASLAKSCGFTDQVLMSGEFDTQDLVGKVFLLEKRVKGVKLGADGKEKKEYESTYHPAVLATETEALFGPSNDLPF